MSVKPKGVKPPASVADLVSSRVLRLSNTLALYAGRRYREEFGITLPEWRVLSIIATGTAQTAQEVSQVLATDKGWVGRSADALRRRFLLTGIPDARDRRRLLLTLTEEGRALHKAVLAVARQRQRRLLGCLPEGGGERLIAYLDLLQGEADRMLARPAAGCGRGRGAKVAAHAQERGHGRQA